MTGPALPSSMTDVSARYERHLRAAQSRGWQGRRQCDGVAIVDADTCFLSAITVFELELGTLLMERRDPKQGARLRDWIDRRVLREFSGRTLPVDSATALRCARLHVPNPRSERDAHIAATALAHRMTVVTRNVADFATTGVSLLNPWQVSAD